MYGAGDETRTRGPVITNHVLYQLSHTSIIGATVPIFYINFLKCFLLIRYNKAQML